MSNLRKAVMGRNVRRLGPGAAQNNFAPVKWTEYFEVETKVSTSRGDFNVYKRGDQGPALVCLHGGGYSGLTWSLFAVEISNLIECQVVAMDQRGHGNSTTDDNTDLSLDILAEDVVETINHVFKDEGPPIVLVGHSMGGAVAVQVSHLLKSVVGLCVIDVVEGTALDALSSMQSILRGRPSQFNSIQHAIQWCYKGGQTQNIDAAKVSMPGQIVNMKTGNLAANECDTIELKSAEEMSKSFKKTALSATSVIEEQDETDATGSTDFGKPPLPKTAKTESVTLTNAADTDSKYTWRIDLSKTESFWTGWFKGLSQKFLDIRVPKVLLLANIHGLDTALTVGQMQGKFQLQVMQSSGHAIHEDQPHNVAEIIGGYLVKQKIATAKGNMVCSMPGC